jgi:hypothetical protein
MIRGRGLTKAIVASVLIGSTMLLGAGSALAVRGGGGGGGAGNWQLVDYAQSACFSANVHDAYYGVWINGTWTKAINVGASGLPAGASFDTSYAPIPPGSSTGIYSLAYVHVTMTTNPPVGTYTASMWATDGKTTKSVPIVLNVKTSCGY